MRTKVNRAKGRNFPCAPPMRMTKWKYDLQVCYLPFEDHSWSALGNECQWRHLAVGDHHAKDQPLQCQYQQSMDNNRTSIRRIESMDNINVQSR